MQKHVNLVDLVKSFPTNIYLQNLASIQERTSPVKFAHLAEKSGKGSISNLSTKAPTDKPWSYDSKLTPWTWTDHYSSVTEPEAQKENPWTYHSKLKPWIPQEAAVAGMGVQTSPESVNS